MSHLRLVPPIQAELHGGCSQRRRQNGYSPLRPLPQWAAAPPSPRVGRAVEAGGICLGFAAAAAECLPWSAALVDLAGVKGRLTAGPRGPPSAALPAAVATAAVATAVAAAAAVGGGRRRWQLRCCHKI